MRITESQLLWRRQETVLNSMPITSQGAGKETDKQNGILREGLAGRRLLSSGCRVSGKLPQERSRELDIKTVNNWSPKARTNWII